MLKYLLNQFLIKIKITTIIIPSEKNVCIKQPKKNDKTFFDSIITLRFLERKVPKEKFDPTKKPIKIWDVNVDDIQLSQNYLKQKLIQSI